MTTNKTALNTPSYTTPACLVCQRPLSLRLAQGRQSKKPFLMLVCATDGRHFRGFVNDKQFVAGVVAKLEAQASPEAAP